MSSSSRRLKIETAGRSELVYEVIAYGRNMSCDWAGQRALAQQALGYRRRTTQLFIYFWPRAVTASGGLDAATAAASVGTHRTMASLG